jgi:hypothetical protein
LSIENLVFSLSDGFLFGAIAGYAIGLFVASPLYPSYKGWIDVKWIERENATSTTLTNLTGQAVHGLNNTSSHFAAYSTTLQAASLPRNLS